MAKSDESRLAVRLVRGAIAILALPALVLGALTLEGQRAPASAADGEKRVLVVAGIPPVAGLVQRIGGAHVQVEVLVQPGQDPHLYEPTPRQAHQLGKARLFFKIGLPLENRLVERVAESGAEVAIVDAAAGIARRHSECTEHDHDHHEASDHDHDDDANEADPHVWLSPPNLRIMARNIAAALEGADAAHTAEYRQELARVEADLDALQARIRKTLTPYRGQTFFVFHPAFGYFADAYGMKQEAVEVEGKEPTPQQLRALVHHARSAGVKIIFLQPRFDPRTADVVAHAIDGVSVPLNPLAEDTIANLEDIAEKIAAAQKTRGS